MTVIPAQIKVAHNVKKTYYGPADIYNYDLTLAQIDLSVTELGTLHRVMYSFPDGSAAPLRPIVFDRLGVTGWYLHKEENLEDLFGRARLCAARLFSEPGTFGFFDTVQATIDDAFGYDDQVMPNADRNVIFKFAQNLVSKGSRQEFFRKESISAGHLRFTTWAEFQGYPVAKMVQDNWPVFNLLYTNRDSGWNEAFSVGLVLWFSLLGPTLQRLASMSCLLANRKVSMDIWSKDANRLSNSCKVLQNIADVDLLPLFECGVLVNRGVGKVDWAAERDHRINTALAEIPPGEVKRVVTSLFDVCKKQFLPKPCTDFTSFWEARWEWSTTGAYHSQYSEDNVVKPHRLINNKMYHLVKMGRRSLQDFLKRSPSIEAWPSVKYEWGKQRAIYGCDFTNYVLTTYAMWHCEDVLDAKFPIGKRAEDTQVRRSVSQILKNGVPCCLDFADFNSQHSYSSMMAVLEAYRDAYASYMHAEQLKALDWVIQSIPNTVVRGKDETYLCAGTLMSGWRLTSFMNTVLNYVYKTLANEGLRHLPALHNGDDIIVAVKSLSDVQYLMSRLKRQGNRLQPTKCFTASVAEFLRVDHETGESGQYLARAISTFVHGKTESVVPVKFLDVLGAIHTRDYEVRIRAANRSSLHEHVYEKMVKFCAEKWDVDMSLVNELLLYHVSAGGLNTRSDALIGYQFEEVRFDRPGLDDGETDLKEPLPGKHVMSLYEDSALSKKN